MDDDDFKPIKIGVISVLILFAFYGFMQLFYRSEYAKQMEYYENGVKIDAIEYHNEIYLKKGE